MNLNKLFKFGLSICLLSLYSLNSSHKAYALSEVILYNPNQDVFTTTATSNGNRRMLLIGNFTDYTMNPSPTFPKSISYLKFNIDITRPILEAKLHIFVYASNSSISVYATKITAPWPESINYPGPTTYGNYGQVYIPKHNATNSTDLKEIIISINPNIFNGSSYGLALRPTNDPNDLGIAFCSSNSDSFCTSRYKPILEITYNIPPTNTPIPTATNTPKPTHTPTAIPTLKQTIRPITTKVIKTTSPTNTNTINPTSTPTKLIIPTPTSIVITPVISNTGSITINYYMNSKSTKVGLINLSPPIINSISANSQGKIIINGNNIANNGSIKSTVNITYSSYYEALKNCNTNEFQVFINTNSRTCIQNELGIKSFWDWRNKHIANCGYSIPVYTQYCLASIYTNFRNTNTINIESKINQATLEAYNQYNLKIAIDNVQLFQDKFNTIISKTDAIKIRFKLGISISHSLLPRTIQIYPIDTQFSKVYSTPINTLKILPLAYFNQYLEPNMSYYPKDGWQMCGAASAVIASSGFNKLTYVKEDDHNLKKLMYSDSLIDKNGIKCGFNKGGAFSLTNINCNTNSGAGVQRYLSYYGLKSNYISKIDYDLIKVAINNGHPIVFGYGDRDDRKFGHIAIIVGYTKDNNVIVHDTYTNTQKLGRGWKSYLSGKNSEYNIFNPKWPIGFLLEVFN
jgi:hypothetical protein